MKYLLYIFITAVFTLTFLNFAIAQEDGATFDTVNPGDSAQIVIENPVQWHSLQDIVIAIAEIIQIVAIPIGTFMIIYSGILFLTSRGDPQRLARAKTNFVWTLVGIGIALAVFSIIKTIEQFIVGKTLI